VLRPRGEHTTRGGLPLVASGAASASRRLKRRVDAPPDRAAGSRGGVTPAPILHRRRPHPWPRMVRDRMKACPPLICIDCSNTPTLGDQVYLQGFDSSEIISTVHGRPSPTISATAGSEIRREIKRGRVGPAHAGRPARRHTRRWRSSGRLSPPLIHPAFVFARVWRAAARYGRGCPTGAASEPGFVVAEAAPSACQPRIHGPAGISLPPRTVSERAGSVHNPWRGLSNFSASVFPATSRPHSLRFPLSRRCRLGLALGTRAPGRMSGYPHECGGQRRGGSDGPRRRATYKSVSPTISGVFSFWGRGHSPRLRRRSVRRGRNHRSMKTALMVSQISATRQR
jgi:hypothetical protein